MSIRLKKQVSRRRKLIDVTLDNWKPTPQKVSFRAPSEWRKNQNKNSCDPHVGRMDVFKINAYLANNVSIEEVAKTFNTTTKLVEKIRDGLYCPIEGPRETWEEKEIKREHAKMLADKRKIAKEEQENGDQIQDNGATSQ